MRIDLSAAVTADGFLDDTSTNRLQISSPEDWEEVLRLRTTCDAILVGAETLRRDDPALLLRDDRIRAIRQFRGMRPDLTRVTVTRSGNLDPALRFFHEGDADKIVFSNREIPDIQHLATVICCDTPITAAYIATHLERRGIRRLLVEGGAQILRMFLDEGMADSLRLAINPLLTLGTHGGAQFRFNNPQNAPFHSEIIGGTEVATYLFHPDCDEEDRAYLQQAIDASRNCPPSPTAYCVGAVIRTIKGEVFTGYTHETSATHHAEQEAIAKALSAGADLRGATIYSSMEPCSQRASEPLSCTRLIIRHGFSRVVFALYEPDCFVCCQGAQLLREAGIEVKAYPEMADAVRQINAHLWSNQK